MTEIKITCPDCGRAIKVRLKTVDILKHEIMALKADRDYYKRKLSAIELMNKTRGDMSDLFGGLF